MKVICASCNAVYNIPERKMPAVKAVARCKKCGGTITVDPGKASSNGRHAPLPGTPHPDSLTPSQDQQRPPTPAETADLKKISDVYPETHTLSNDKFDLLAMLTPSKNGSYKTRRNKYKVRILKAVQDKVDQVLNHGEKVMRIGQGIAYYPLELFLGNGWLTMIYNRYAILCTNQRMLFLNINHRMNRSTHYLFQMPYTDIKKIKRGMLLNHLILYRHQGKRRIFTSVKGYLNKELRAFVAEMKEVSGDRAPVNVSAEKLCPSCFIPLDDGLGNCPRCGVGFKVPKTAMVRSLILPGLGDMYLGHRVLGALEMLGAILVWMIVISSLIAGGVENIVTAAVLLLMFNGLDGMLTYHMAKKGYMLADSHPGALSPISA